MRLSIRDLLKASPTPSEGAPKLLAITSASTEEQNASAWMLAELSGALTSSHTQFETATYHLGDMHLAPCVGCYGGGGRMCMHPCDRNDIASEIYDATDEMLEVYQQLIDADVLVLAADVRWGGLDAHAQRFIERLNPVVNQLKAGRPLWIKPKLAVVLLAAHDRLGAAPTTVLAALNQMGFALPVHGFRTWLYPSDCTAQQCKERYDRDLTFHQDLDLTARSLVSLVRRMDGP